MATTTECGRCVQDQDHCHEVLVVHVDGTFECFADGTCEGRFEVHEWVLDCADLGHACACAGEVAAATAA